MTSSWRNDVARTDDSDDSIDFEKERAAFEQKKKSRKSDGGKDRPKTDSKRAPRDEKVGDKKSKPKKSKKDEKPPKDATSGRSKGKDIPNDEHKSRDKHREHVTKADQGAGVGARGAQQQQAYEGRQQRLSESSDDEREGGVQKKQVKKKKRAKKETKMPEWMGAGKINAVFTFPIPVFLQSEHKNLNRKHVLNQ